MKIKIECAHDKVVALDKLKPHPANPNKHPEAQIALLAKIIKAQGWRNPIVVSNRSGFITKGHARLEAAKLIGTDKAPVDYQDYKNEKSELADMIADNRIAELAEPDRTMLRELAEQLDDGAFDMDLTGFDQDALEELMTAAHPEIDIDAEPQIDKADELCKKWGVKRGQIWQLGAHRLMCGDCTKESVLNGDRASGLIADPPYGMNLDTDYSVLSGSPRAQVKSGGRKHRKIIGDQKPFDASTVILGKISEQFWFGADYYFPTLNSNGGSWLVWDKRLDEDKDEMFGSHFELIWSAQKHKRRILRHLWAGVAHASGDKRIFDHPSTKSTFLIRELIERWVKGEIIYDPFCGSGTTIIACEQLGRKCRAMEIDPGYVAVSIQRWADATGKTPVLLE